MSIAGKFLAFDGAGDPIGSSGTGADLGLREDLAGPTGGSLVANALSEGADLRAQTVSEYIEGGPVMPSQFAGTDEQRLVRSITEAGAVRNDALGGLVQLPRGVIEVAEPFNIMDRAAVRGVNKRGSVIQAADAFADPYMATVVNGTASMFDNSLSHLTLNCNDVAGLGGVLSDAWQEGGGLREVLIQKFRTYGVRFQNGYGGAAFCVIDGCEIFGSEVGAATAGVKVDQISLVGGFQLHVTNTTVAGSPGFPMTYGVHVENDSLHCHVVHFEEVGSGVYLDGAGSHVLIGVTGSDTVTNVVEIAPTFTGSLTMLGCMRRGAANLLTDNRPGGLGTISADRDIRIDAAPPIALGAPCAAGVLNGAGAPALTKGFGVSSITDNGPGDYTLFLTTTAQDPNDFALFASQNGGDGRVVCEAAGINSVRIRTFDATGAAADANQIKFLVARVA